MKKINVGIIGKNFGYKLIYTVIHRIKEFNTIAFCFKNPVNFKTINKIKIYTDWKKMLSNKKIDAVIISSPPETHLEIIKTAIKKKIHIFCEKPVTKSYKQVMQVINLLENKKLLHIVNYEFPKIAAFKFFKKNILKKIHIKKIQINWTIKMPQQKRSSWKNFHNKGGGIFYNYICHTIYYLQELFGDFSIENVNKDRKKNPMNIKIKLRNIKKNFIIYINFKILSLKSKQKPIHQIKIFDKNNNFELFSKTKSLSDQFILKKSNKVIFKPIDNKKDFRFYPVFENLKNFQKSINEKKILKPNFFDAEKIHFLINRISSIR